MAIVLLLSVRILRRRSDMYAVVKVSYFGQKVLATFETHREAVKYARLNNNVLSGITNQLKVVKL